MRRGPQFLCADRIKTTPERGSIDVAWVGACAVRKSLVYMDDWAEQCQLGAEQPVSPLRGPKRMGAHQAIPPIHAVDRIVFFVSGIKKPQHALQSPGRVR